MSVLRLCNNVFQSTPPVKAATKMVSRLCKRQTFQSTPPVKAATYLCSFRNNCVIISIHAAREGGDVVYCVCCRYCVIFQSTPPVKAATGQTCIRPAQVYISIHAAREGGDISSAFLSSTFRISIHAAREGGDNYFVIIRLIYKNFNPRRP